MKITIEQMKNIFEILELVNAKRCPIKMLALIINNGSKFMQ